MYGISGRMQRWIKAFLTERTMQVRIRKELSETQEVLSGVPQGSVIGPLLFLMYVDELPTMMRNNMKLFADDSKLWCRIRKIQDSLPLQRDLDVLMEWSRVWQLGFNIEKCKLMKMGHGLQTQYHMWSSNRYVQLEEVEEERDLGVIVTSTLKPSQQCAKAAAAARKIISMVKRNFRRLDKDDFLIIYKTYIRPHLEYCVQSWSPHLNCDMNMLEKTQMLATTLVGKLKSCTYDERLRALGLTTLKERRRRGDMIEVYKLLTGKENVAYDQFFSIEQSKQHLRGHTMRLVKERSRLDVRKYSFGQRVVNDWNALPLDVVTAATVNGFKNAYDRHAGAMDVRS